MNLLRPIAEKYNLVIVEDACQAVGATFNGQKAGSFGIGIFSLYATKNVMSAEGGMITTNNDDIAERLRLLRNHGMEQKYYHKMLGFNFRTTDINAAIGLTQLARLDKFNEQRRANAAYLNKGIDLVIKPQELDGCRHVWHQYTIRVDGESDRDKAVGKLNDAGIGTGIYYPVPAHHHKYMRNIVGEVSMPVTERLAKEVISLPVHPQLSGKELEKIVREVNRL